MPKLPRLTAAELVRKLQEAGFVKTRQSGSHAIFRHINGARFVVPIHARKTLHPKIVKEALNLIALTRR